MAMRYPIAHNAPAIPVYLFTFHAYRSWAADNPNGYVQRSRPGIQPPSKGLAEHRSAIANDPPTRFNDAQKALLLEGVQDICGRRNWRLHGASATPSHMHVLVSWTTPKSPRDLTTPMKRLLGMMLSQNKGDKGNRWFSRGCDETQVRNREHLAHLINEYVPKHINQDGVVWIEPRA